MNPPDRWRQLVCTWARPWGGWGLTHLLRRVGVSSQWAAMMVDKKDRFVTDTMCSFPAPLSHARALLCFFLKQNRPLTDFDVQMSKAVTKSIRFYRNKNVTVVSKGYFCGYGVCSTGCREAVHWAMLVDGKLLAPY
jgi:hypothetical protein